MYGGLARFVVKPGKLDEFLEVVRWSSRIARDEEPGTLRLDVWQVDGEPDIVYGYECYTDRDAFEAHIKNAAVRRFGEVMDDLVEGWTMVIPFTNSTASNADLQ
ncbi:antibiotic biosynthesis monooxygenase [Kribbella sp. NBC_00382]|uniref:putative quinol monooxygenase n=1 Tax=Kribbella sp. NBC_00382 TaxID=2975967 RepID=UPI002E1BDB4D